jgi:hypothetical protein
MGKDKGEGTPDELDYLFERDIIDEEDYVYFWRNYWKRGESGRQSLINEFLDMASESESTLGNEGKLAGVVTKNKAAAIRQAKSIGGKVVRRNKRGQFHKRGRSYQAVRHGKKKR